MTQAAPKLSKTEAEGLLQQHFSYLQFRPGQWESLEALLQGQDLLLIKATGGGKSLVYQYMAAALEKRVLVLSPLVALMDDQLYQAKKYKIRAGAVHSQMPGAEKERCLAQWERGELNLLFVTPERFFIEKWQKSLLAQEVDLLVVDEAHCLSQWGHDFRPDYSKVGEIRKMLGGPRVFACTATATEETEKDIKEQLGFGAEAVTLRDSVMRTNLVHQKYSCFDYKNKMGTFFGFQLLEGPTLIYFSLIKNLEKLSDDLSRLGLEHLRYHSKLHKKERRENQRLFIEGKVDMILATPAFGLGVDKANIRNLIHFELPSSIEAYVQEFGRAGRDGKKSHCYLMYSQEDIQQQMDFLKWAYPSADTIRWVYRQIQNCGLMGFSEYRIRELKEKMNFYNSYDFRIESALNILTRWEVLKKEKGTYFIASGNLNAVPDLQIGTQEELIKRQQEKLLELLQLARLEDPEWSLNLKKYFGESAGE